MTTAILDQQMSNLLGYSYSAIIYIILTLHVK